MKTDKMVTKMA